MLFQVWSNNDLGLKKNIYIYIYIFSFFYKTFLNFLINLIFFILIFFQIFIINFMKFKSNKIFIKKKTKTKYIILGA